MTKGDFTKNFYLDYYLLPITITINVRNFTQSSSFLYRYYFYLLTTIRRQKIIVCLYIENLFESLQPLTKRIQSL